MSVDGWWLGAKTAFWLALIYGCGFILFNIGTQPLSAIPLLVAAPIIAIVMAVVGVVLGGLIEWDLQQAKTTSTVGAIVVGLAVAAGPALALHLIFLGPTFNIGSDNTLSSEYHEAYFTIAWSKVYFTFLGWPSLIATVASGWLGWRINQKLRTANQAANLNSFAAFATTQPVELKDYIAARRDTHSRYEIDLALIRHGHDPQAIETTWQTFTSATRPTSWQRLFRYGLYWPVGLALISGIVYIFDPIYAAALFVTGMAIGVMVVQRSHFVAGLLFCLPFYWWLVRLFFLG